MNKTSKPCNFGKAPPCAWPVDEAKAPLLIRHGAPPAAAPDATPKPPSARQTLAAQRARVLELASYLAMLTSALNRSTSDGDAALKNTFFDAHNIALRIVATGLSVAALGCADPQVELGRRLYAGFRLHTF